MISFVFTSGYFFGQNGFRLETGSFPSVKISRELPKNREDIDFSLFWRVWDTIEASYYDKSKINVSRMVYGAISGLTASLGDPYTAFLPPEENKVIEEDLSGSFEGVGIQIGFKGKNLAVIAPLPNSPAEKAGVKAGDFIVGITDLGKGIDTGTAGITLSDAVKMIRGKSGTKVILFLVRDGAGEPLKTEITRESLDVPSVTISFIEDNTIAHVKLLKFGADTDVEWNSAVSSIINHQPSIIGIVLDLRNNPGGYLQGAVDIAGDFVEPGTVVVVEDKGDIKNDFKSERSGKLGKSKVVVLVNAGSASASEILAGALREIKNYQLIGETTFGKGTIQEPLQLEKGAGLHLTTAKWLTPRGVWVNEIGLKPDIEIVDNPETAEDEQLLEAIKTLSKN